ncbi:hypothetical protein L9F63_005387, partial [Diploptera punctata]
MSTAETSAAAEAAARAKKLNLDKATNFMRQYRDPQSRELKKLSANQFMEVWSHYDRDGNGYIEGTELDGFLREFVSSANATDVSPELIFKITFNFLQAFRLLEQLKCVSVNRFGLLCLHEE